MDILVTGGAGYIGSHTVVELLNGGHNAVIVDNFSNSNPEVITRLHQISGKKIYSYRGDVRDASFLGHIFETHHIDAVIHFAGLKSVGGSLQDPLKYYSNNIDSSLVLCKVMLEKGVKKLVFSSSATIYGAPKKLPVAETHRTGQGITNPYGQTKYMIERMLHDFVAADPRWQITSLRYFNPVGAHPSGAIGEDPQDIPNNLMPYIAQVAIGKLKRLQVFGDDYDTIDGTGVRDYVHVVDIAQGHVAALERMQQRGKMEVYNLGTGRGTSVLELVTMFEKVSHRTIPYAVVKRRPGDLASVYADVSKAQRELGWRAQKTIEDACADSWRWQSQNPAGYRKHEMPTGL